MDHRTGLKLAASLLLVLAAGCARVPYKAKMPDIADHCVGAWSKLPIQPFAVPPKPGKAAPYSEFADQAHCLSSPALAKAAPVVVYDVHGLKRPSEVDVDLGITSGGTLAASVDLLDADFKPVRHYGFGKFTHRGGIFSLPVFLNAGDEAIHYLVVRPDPAFVGKKWKTIGSMSNMAPVVVPGGTFMLQTGGEVEQSHQFMSGGRFLVHRIGGA